MTHTATSNPPNSAAAVLGTPLPAERPRRRWRVRWRRLLFVAALTYVGAGAAFSAVRGWELYRQEQALQARIAAVEAQNRVLQQDVRALRNPVTLKAMLQGKRPLPNATVPNP
ncbi:MAG: hypothetical protein K6V97_10835 [Actinomycetia bacterium]|nr:hypothetical protein [Actinomycetes bacterium]